MNRWTNTTAKDVVTISGYIHNTDTRTVANAVNYNAQVLKDALNRIAGLEKMGHWIDEIMPLSDASKECVRCSQCGLHYDVASYYCPNCGARMEVRKHERSGS